MEIKRRSLQRPPTHPGRVVKLELEELGMTITQAADRRHVARPTLSRLVNENQGVSPEMALKLGRFFGNGTELWFNMQTRFDQWRVEHDRDAIEAADRVEPVTA